LIGGPANSGRIALTLARSRKDYFGLLETADCCNLV
jgi:hypothetical protein